MTTAIVRQFLIGLVALNLVLGSMVALGGAAVHEAAAAGPCWVYPNLTLGGSRQIIANGQTKCDQSNFQKVTTILKMNGVEIGRTTRHGWTTAISSTVWGPTCRPGALYQTVVVHQYGDGNSSPARTDVASTGAPYRMCS